MLDMKILKNTTIVSLVVYCEILSIRDYHHSYKDQRSINKSARDQYSLIQKIKKEKKIDTVTKGINDLLIK